MANINTSTVAEALGRTYLRQTFLVPFERTFANFYSQVEDFSDGGDLRGSARYFEIATRNSHASAITGSGTTGESATLPTFSAPASVQAAISPVTLLASLEISELLLAVGQGDGLLSKMDVIDRYVKMTRECAVSNLNRATLGHGTGRMAVVQATTDTATTFVCRNPESVYQLRVGMLIASYDTDATGGTVDSQAITNYRQITAINPETRTVTVDAAATYTIGHGIYKVGLTHATAPTTEFLISTNGLRNINDDGTLAATIYGITRSANTSLNATVIDASLGAYSEAGLRKGVDRIQQNTGLLPDAIWSNSGMVGEHLNSLTGSRVFQTTGSSSGVPAYQTGASYKGISFIGPDGSPIPFNVDRDLPNREINIVTQRYFRRMVARPLNWIGDNVGPDGSPTPILLQTPASTTYAFSKIAGMAWIGNICHLQPKANTRWTNLADAMLAGD